MAVLLVLRLILSVLLTPISLYCLFAFIEKLCNSNRLEINNFLDDERDFETYICLKAIVS